MKKDPPRSDQLFLHRRAAGLPVLRWLQVGAATAGMGVAMLAASATAAADTDSGSAGASSATADSSTTSESASSGTQDSSGTAESDRAGSSPDLEPDPVTDDPITDDPVTDDPVTDDDVSPLSESEELNTAAATVSSRGRSTSADLFEDEPEEAAAALANAVSGDAVSSSAVTASPVTGSAPTGPVDDLSSSAVVADTGLSVDPVVGLVEGYLGLTHGVINGDLRAESARGLPLTFTPVGTGSNGGEIVFNVDVPGTFAVLPRATWLEPDGVKGTEQFSVRVSEVTRFDRWLTSIPVVRLLAAPVIEFLQQVPVLKDFLAPLIGRSMLTKINVDVAALAPGDASIVSIPPVSGKPGLISMDWMTANEETGELGGDEPVMVTGWLERAPGVGSRTGVVNDEPEEMDWSVDAGDVFPIPEEDSDIWFNVAPLTLADFVRFQNNKQLMEMPFVVTATMLFEGDHSDAEDVGEMGKEITKFLAKYEGELVAASRSFVNSGSLATAMGDALNRSTAQLEARLDGYGVATRFANTLEFQWKAEDDRRVDADDPIGLSITVLIPVDSTVTDEIAKAGGPAAVGLNVNDQYVRDATALRYEGDQWKTDIATRTGLIVPYTATPEGHIQYWTTDVAGKWKHRSTDNDWAAYKMETWAWPQTWW